MTKRELGSMVVLFTLTYACSDPGSTPSNPAAQAGSGGTAPASAGSASSAGNGGTGNPTPGGGAASGGQSSGGTSSTGGSGNTGGSAGGAAGSAPIDPVGPTPEAKWTNVTSNLAGMASECGNLGRVSSHPATDLLIAGVAQKGLFGSSDGGATWTPLGAGGAVITNRISWLAYDPTAPKTFWESGIYNGGGVYKTTDGGATFTAAGNVTHNDSVSVDFSDPARMTLLAGSHEQAQKLFRSTDGGVQWQDIGMKLPAGSGFCTTSLILNNKTFLIGCGGWYGGDPGIHRTEDGGESFTPVSSVGVAGQPLRASDGTIYWAGHQAGGLYRSTDQGKTFMQVADAKQSRSAEPIELPDGRIVTVGEKTLMVSANKGDSWEPLLDELPWVANGVSYSPFRNAFYVWRWDCGDVVLSDAILRFGYDYRN